MTTDEDRKKATRVITQAAGSELWTKPLIDAVAQAIAEEREKARAPFLALAEELAAEAPGREAWDGNEMAAFMEIIDRILRAAEDDA